MARSLRSARSKSERALHQDAALKIGLQAFACLILIVVGYFFIRLSLSAYPVFHHEGLLNFIFRNDWNVARDIYGAWPLVAGTLITSAIALIIGIPVAVSAALYVTELAPSRLRGILALLLDMLAAVPSVVYGLWGVFILIPSLKPFEQWASHTLGFIPFLGGTVKGPNYFIAGLILAIMILPIVSAISREVMATVPPAEKEGALALGATRWEMIRLSVWPHSRAGIISAALLGLGRAVGETIAVTLVIGSAPTIGHHIFDQGYSLAAVIANEFGEAGPGSLHLSALIAAGLVLFVLTLLINGAARAMIFNTYRQKVPASQGGGV